MQYGLLKVSSISYGRAYERHLSAPEGADLSPTRAGTHTAGRGALIGAALGAVPGAVLAATRAGALGGRTSLTRGILAGGLAGGAIGGVGMAAAPAASAAIGAGMGVRRRELAKKEPGTSASGQRRDLLLASAVPGTLGALGGVTAGALARNPRLAAGLGVAGGMAGGLAGYGSAALGRLSAKGERPAYVRSDERRAARRERMDEAAATRRSERSEGRDLLRDILGRHRR